jgi:hypothetical protein
VKRIAGCFLRYWTISHYAFRYFCYSANGLFQKDLSLFSAMFIDQCVGKRIKIRVHLHKAVGTDTNCTPL